MSKKNSDYWGLLMQCPMNKETSDCVFAHIRSLPLLERMKFFDELCTIEREDIIRKHKKCLIGREKRIPFSRIAIM